MVSTRCVLPSASAACRRRSASRAACPKSPAIKSRAIASGSMILSPLKPLMRVRVDLPHPFGPATTRRVGMGAEAGRDRPTATRAGGAPGPLLWSVRYRRRPNERVERAASLDLGRQVRFDLVTPALWKPGYFGRRRGCINVLEYVFDHTSNSRAVQYNYNAARTEKPLSRCRSCPGPVSSGSPPPSAPQLGSAPRHRDERSGSLWTLGDALLNCLLFRRGAVDLFRIDSACDRLET